MTQSLSKSPYQSRRRMSQDICDRSPCVVKSLASGNFRNITKTRDDDQAWAHSPSTTTTSSPSSFFSSTIGVCTGTTSATFPEEERRMEYRYEKNGRYNPLEKTSKENRTAGTSMGDLILKFSNTPLPVSGSGTDHSIEITAGDSGLFESDSTPLSTPQKLDKSRFTTPPLSKPKHSNLRNTTNRHNNVNTALSSARKLIFGGDCGSNKSASHDNNSKSTSPKNCPGISSPPFQCQCENGSDVIDTDKNAGYDKFYQWYNIPALSSRSLMKSSFPPTEALYTPAYDDDDDDDESKQNKNIGIFADSRHMYSGMGRDAYSPKTIRSSIQNSHDESISGSGQVSRNFHSRPQSVSFSHAASSMGGHHEIQYWRKRLQYFSKHYGKSHSSTADAFFNLGLAQLKLPGITSSCADSSMVFQDQHANSKDVNTKKRHQFNLAIENLTIAHGILERKYGVNHVAVGRALDALALAIVRRANHDRAVCLKASSSQSRKHRADDLEYARRLLEQAVQIRIDHLGVWHADTVESFNKLAGVYLHLGHIREAADAYGEVHLVRKAIFGPNHPSVAIAAHSLANCHFRLKEVKHALRWYEVSLDIYETMGLSYRHPTVAKLLRDRSRLEDFIEA